MKYRRILLTIVLLSFSMMANAAGKRVALVIANSQYQNIKALRNPKNDAEAVAERLQKVGFTLIKPIQNSDVQYDLNLKDLLKANQALKQATAGAEMVLLYYAGHGLQINGIPYLVPTDLSSINTESLKDDSGRDLLRRELVELDTLVSGLDNQAQVAIAMFDACREIPELETASRAVFGSTNNFRGLARPSSQGRHRLLAYSALSGQFANDGNSTHSPYTQAWLQEFDKNLGMDILAFYNHVATQIQDANGQNPEVVTQGVKPNTYYIQTANTPTPTPPQADLELSFWNSIKGSQNPADFQAYLEQYPNGHFVSLANNRLQALTTKSTPPVINNTESSIPAVQAKPVDNTSAKTTFRGKGLEMINVKGGTFLMSDSEHSVTVGDFQIGKYEVTQALWQEVMGNNPSYLRGDNLPVDSVSYNDVQAFLKKLNEQTGKNYRLPTEAEWEYACRSGGKAETYCGGENIDDLAWYYENSGKTAHEVGTKQANGLGLYDMSGNVSEWCVDLFYREYSTFGLTNSKGATIGQETVFRGGSWFDGAKFIRSVKRYSGFTLDYRYYYMGFRLALGQTGS